MLLKNKNRGKSSNEFVSLVESGRNPSATGVTQDQQICKQIYLAGFFFFQLSQAFEHRLSVMAKDYLINKFHVL